ncbi:MAG: vancomycin resistance protein [Sulfurovum sp.]|nr:MAG: vancomycin resistance protein [Sulfurovum sp.]
MRKIKWLFLLTILGVVTLYSIDKYVSTFGDIYRHTKGVPQKNAALLLGTAKYARGGGQNYFYTYRIRAAVALWKAGKVKAIVVSGDNGTKYYDETTTMYEDLVKAGVPARYITKDYAGFRTLDSVLRAEAIFDLKDYIIISQKFHLERALFIAKAKGQKAIGFVAKDIPGTAAAYRMKVREYLARAKAFLDVYILHTEPKFYGKKEKVRYKDLHL